MVSRRVPVVLALLIAVAVVLFVAQAGGIAHFVGSEDRATVTIIDEDGERLATVDAEVADSSSERYTGLSDHESLGEDEGMLFVYENEDERSFVMREMAFPIDMIFVGGDGRITTIHEAPTEDDGDLTSYRGEARWVLEVNYGYADANDIEEGDRVEIEYR